MKSKLPKAKLICFFLAILITLQSCVAYESTSIPITKAAQSGEKMLVINSDGKRMPFQRIEKNDSLYYGIKKVFSKEVKILLTPSKIKKIRPHDPRASTLGNIGLILLGMLAIIIPIKLIELKNDMDSFGEKR